MKTGLFFNRLHLRANALLLSLLITSGLLAQTQAPESYYDRAEGLSDKELKTALHEIIKVGKRLDYGSGAGKTWSGFEKSDLHPEGHVWDMYSNNKRYFPGNAAAPDGMNIEHSVASSWWGGTKNEPYKDLYHLNPSDERANSARSNYPLGINNGAQYSNGAIKVGNNTFPGDYNGVCFEPLDEYKGDFARAYMYMFTCYENLTWTGTATTMLNVSETWPMLKPWAQELLVTWSRMDPPSEKELNRASEVYKLQENRNPFIDYPELVEHLWGNLVGVPFTMNSTTPAITSPYNNATILLPETHYTAEVGQHIMIKGRNLTQNTAIRLTGANAHLFKLEASSLTAEEMNEGKSVEIVFVPETAGNFEVTLELINAEITTPITATITGRATDNFQVLPATDITSEGFTAHWSTHSQANGYELMLYRKEISNNADITVMDQKMTSSPEGWETGGYVEFNGQMARLASGKNFGSLITPAIDLSKPAKLTVKAKQFSSDNGAPITVKVDGQEVGVITTTTTLMDYLIELPEATNESQIEFYSPIGKRTYIDQVTIIMSGTGESYVPVDGYPIQAGMATSYSITGLDANTQYAYEVTTLAEEPVKTGLTEVLTAIETGIEDHPLNEIYGYGGYKKIYLYNLPENAMLRIFDLSGRICHSRVSYSGSEQINVKTNGVFLVRITANNQLRTLKILVK